MHLNVQPTDLIRWATERVLVPVLRHAVQDVLDREGLSWWDSGVVATLQRYASPNRLGGRHRQKGVSSEGLAQLLDLYALLKLASCQATPLFGISDGLEDIASRLLDARNRFSHLNQENNTPYQPHEAQEVLDDVYRFLKRLSATKQIVQLAQYEQRLAHITSRSSRLRRRPVWVATDRGAAICTA